MINPFFKNKGPFNIDELLKLSSTAYISNFKDNEISDIKDLTSACEDNITFFIQKNMKI